MDSLSVALKASTFTYILLTVIGSAAAAPESDLVTNLPDQPALDFKIFSGYVTVDENNGRALFYYFVEAQSNSESKPLTLWLNGGPGCSSFGAGNFMEHGPFTIRDNAIVLNPYSWNQESNMLYLESPAGVGFSYSNTTSDYFTDDEKTAEDSFTFLQGWVEKFPEYRNRTFYISGESYAGYYIPQLAALMVNRCNTSESSFLQLKGILMGNPVIDIDDWSFKSMSYFLMVHGQISDNSYEKLQVYCDSFNLGWNNIVACTDFLDFVYDNETGAIDVYNVVGDTCPSVTSSMNFIRKVDNLKFQNRLTSKSVAPIDRDPCHALDMDPYLNRKDVQAALHAHIANISVPWVSCSKLVNYNISTSTVQPLIKLLIENDLRVWIFSGDQDSVIPFTATRRTLDKFTLANGLNISSYYQPWYSKNQIAGWTVSYGPKLLYAIVKGASHMVPALQPVRALQLFSSFLHDKNLLLGQD
ncbi:hypothetical protein Mapa_012593 [Marchantia paleacea]|nr:hypothetical protein Mapa_012593 [Marchantia paleacea]